MQGQMDHHQPYRQPSRMRQPQRMGQQQGTRLPHRPHRKKRYRWEIITIPAAILLSAIVLKSIDLPTVWIDFLDYIGVRNRSRFTALFVLGVLACCICAIARVLKDGKEGKK